jgi:hypothetical protein
MIFLRIVFDFLVIWGNLKTYLEDKQKELAEINIVTTYGSVEGYTSNEWHLTNRGSGTYEQGLDMCKSHREEIFQVEIDMQISDIFQKMDLSEIWTGLYQSKANQVVDRDGFAPVSLLSDGTLIDISNILVAKIDTQTHATLKWIKDSNTFSYEPVLNSETKTIICKKNLSFPRTRQNLDSLEKFRLDMTGLIKTELAKLEYEKGVFDNVWESIPQFDEGSNVFLPADGSGAQSINLEETTKELKTEIETLGAALSADLKTFGTEVDVVVYSMKMNRWIGLIQDMKNRVTDPVFFPTKMLTRNMAVEKQFDSSNYKTTLIRIDNSELRVRFSKDFTQSIKSSLNRLDWQTVFTKEYFKHQIELLSHRNFFYPSLYDIIYGLTSLTVFLASCVNFCFSYRGIRRIKKTQQKQDIRLFKIREREIIRNQERRERYGEEDGSPDPLMASAPEPEPIREVPNIIPPMYSRPDAMIIDIRDYPSNLPPRPELGARPKTKAKKQKRNRNRNRNRPDPPEVLVRAARRSNTEEPLFEADSFLSIENF